MGTYEAKSEPTESSQTGTVYVYTTPSHALSLRHHLTALTEFVIVL
jgi:hypothetical protein